MSNRDARGDTAVFGYAVAAFLGIASLSELLGRYLVSHDGVAFIYVTLKFVLLPAVSILVVAVVAWRTITRRALTWAAWVGGAVGLAYLIALWVYPLPWL